MRRGNFTLECHRFDAAKFLTETVALMRYPAAVKGLRIQESINIAEEVIYSDQGRIQQVLMVLLRNALRYTQKGYILVSAKVIDPQMPASSPGSLDKLTSPGLRMQIDVEDSGLGMGCDEICNVFTGDSST